MKIIKERSRIIFTEYNDVEKSVIDEIVATDDKVFSYEDPDKQIICFPPGMEKAVKKAFPTIHIIDSTKEAWPSASINPVEHNAEPRNQLQIDFINFVLDSAKKEQKVAGILSPGTGKAQPLSSKIILPDGGFKLMGDIKTGDTILGSDGKPTTVLGTYPQGPKDIYKIELENKRATYCSGEHLWTVKNVLTKEIETISFIRLLRRHYTDYMIPYLTTKGKMMWSKIKKISYSGEEMAQCILVSSPDHLYTTDDNILTHNTFMACYSAIKVGLRTLIIVPTSSIKEQWGETLTKMFNVDPSRVVVVRSPKDFVNVKADFVVVSQASLASLNNNYDLESIMKANKFGIKVIDEVQMWFHNIIKVDACSNIANNWYLTGTFGRSGIEENKLYQEMFGDLAIFREKDKKATIFDRKPGNVYGMKPHMRVKMVWAHSGLTKEEVQSVMTSVRYSERAGKWKRYGIAIPAYTELVIPKDGTRTRFLKTILKVVQQAEREVTYGKTLILGSTIDSCEVVASYVARLFPDKKVGTIHSRHSKAENEQTKAECDIMVSTISSAGTGFDVKGLAKLIVFAAYASWILTDQISGRLRRRDDGKETFMWDIVDADVKQLRSWANSRADVLRRKSKSFKVVDI